MAINAIFFFLGCMDKAGFSNAAVHNRIFLALFYCKNYVLNQKIIHT